MTLRWVLRKIAERLERLYDRVACDGAGFGAIIADEKGDKTDDVSTPDQSAILPAILPEKKQEEYSRGRIVALR